MGRESGYPALYGEKPVDEAVYVYFVLTCVHYDVPQLCVVTLHTCSCRWN